MKMDHGVKKNTTLAIRESQLKTLVKAKKRLGKSMSRMMREALDLYFETQEIGKREAPSIHKVLDDLEATVRSLRAIHKIKSDHVEGSDG